MLKPPAISILESGYKGDRVTEESFWRLMCIGSRGCTEVLLTEAGGEGPGMHGRSADGSGGGKGRGCTEVLLMEAGGKGWGCMEDLLTEAGRKTLQGM